MTVPEERHASRPAGFCAFDQRLSAAHSCRLLAFAGRERRNRRSSDDGSTGNFRAGRSRSGLRTRGPTGARCHRGHPGYDYRPGQRRAGGIGGHGSLASGLLIAVFMFAGWDATAALPLR
jgi:hypothetical protein